uniref:Uncharacterized protein n=2 Tax=Nicotiana TaxID=4085 RepID=A0A1S4D5F7_TOBAC|nr:PREDICTED: uncharacterized protein LOC104216831 [Nicotiana sylvestris]XP_016508509.1 PREDICTED: uncharacterized protein LOC107826077 [Nicotiana tabacum]
MKGEITLPVNTTGTIQEMKLYMIEGELRYNALFGRPWVHNMRAILSTLYQTLKFSIPGGVKTVYEEQPATRDLFVVNEEKQEKWGAYEEDNYGVPRSFIAHDDINDTKSMVEELEQVILIERMLD